LHQSHEQRGTYSPLCSNLTDSSLPSVLPSLALLPVFRPYWSFLIRLVQPSRFHGINRPLIAGLVMSQLGRAVRRQGLEAVEIESFGYGFTFALGMALIRFVFVK
jgi:hypothetical protein